MNDIKHEETRLDKISTMLFQTESGRIELSSASNYNVLLSDIENQDCETNK